MTQSTPSPERIVVHPLEQSAHARPVTSGLSILGLLVLSVVTWIGVDWLALGPDVRFFFYGVPGIVWYVIPILMVAWVLGRVATSPMDYLRALFWVLVAVPIVLIIAHAGDLAFTEENHGGILWPVAACTLVSVMRVATGRLHLIGVTFALCGAALFFWFDEFCIIPDSKA